MVILIPCTALEGIFGAVSHRAAVLEFMTMDVHAHAFPKSKQFSLNIQKEASFAICTHSVIIAL